MLDYHNRSADNQTSTTGGVLEWLDYRLPVFTFLRRELTEYPTPCNLTYLWNFGSLAGIVLVIMIVTEIVLAMHYTPTTAGAFKSVEHIMRDVNYGWLIRYVHSSGASMLLCRRLHSHVSRSLLWSYKAPRELLWIGRRHHPAVNDDDRILWLHLALGSDELLGRHRDYQFVFRDPGCR